MNEELANAIKRGDNVQSAITTYNSKVDALKSEFTCSRGSEYAAARLIEYQPNVAAEEASVGEWKPRNTNRANRIHLAPERMNYSEVELNRPDAAKVGVTALAVAKQN